MIFGDYRCCNASGASCRRRREIKRPAAPFAEPSYFGSSSRSLISGGVPSITDTSRSSKQHRGGASQPTSPHFAVRRCIAPLSSSRHNNNSPDVRPLRRRRTRTQERSHCFTGRAHRDPSQVGGASGWPPSRIGGVAVEIDGRERGSENEAGTSRARAQDVEGESLLESRVRCRKRADRQSQAGSAEDQKELKKLRTELKGLRGGDIVSVIIFQCPPNSVLNSLHHRTVCYAHLPSFFLAYSSNTRRGTLSRHP